MYLQLVVVIADEQHHLTARTQTADQLRKDARSSGERVLDRPLPKFDDVAEQHEPVGGGDRRGQGLDNR